MQSRNIVFILTGPSGAGKTTYSKMLVKKIGNSCRHNITYTTREPRTGEASSEYFKFVGINEFKKQKDNGVFFCDVEFCGNLYAYRKQDLLLPLQEERDLILDSIMPIDTLRLLPTKVIVVYLSARSNQKMLDRITIRTPEMNKDELNLRIRNFISQRELASKCDYIVFTDDSTNEDVIFEKIYNIYKYEKGVLSASNTSNFMASQLASTLPTDIPQPIC